MEAACCPLLAPLLCFCFPSFKAFFVSAEDAWKERGWGMQTEQSSAMAARCPCHRRVGVELSTSGCALCSLPGAWCLHGHWLFSPEPSFHTEKAVASGKKKKKKALWTAPLHRHSQLLLTQAPRNLLRSVHTLLNQPAAERGPAPLPAWAARLPARPQGLKTTKRLFKQHARFSQKCSPLLRSLPWRRPTVCVCFSWREFW